jgi:prepilin-type N-terminal cleavage/methylation domain-containing protein
MYKLKQISKINRKSGMTLVELIVSLVISGIVIAGASVLILSSTNLFGHAAAKQLDEDVANSVLNVYTKNLRYAAGAGVTPTVDSADFNTVVTTDTEAYLFVGNGPESTPTVNAEGKLYIKRVGEATATNYFGDDFYNTRTIKVAYDTYVNTAGLNSDSTPKVTSKGVTVTVFIFREGKQALKKSISVEMLNAATNQEAANSTPPTVASPSSTSQVANYPAATAKYLKIYNAE